MSRKMLCAFTLSLLLAGQANAVITNWTVQSSSSSLSITGTLSSGSTFLAAVSPQGAGSLTTTYSGTIETQSSLSGGNPVDIAITDSNIIAGISGNWDPIAPGTLGTAPANYGALVNLGFLGGTTFAIRNLTLQLLGNSVPLSGVPYGTQNFSALLDADFLTGTSTYRGFGTLGFAFPAVEPEPFIPDFTPFASNGSISYGPGGLAGIATLTIPVNAIFAEIVAGADTTTLADDIGVYFTYSGSIVATAATATVPEASSLVLLGLAGSVIGFVGYRRKHNS